MERSLDLYSENPGTHSHDPEEARINAWFLVGLRHEAIRLVKKYRKLENHELLILDGPTAQNFDDEVFAVVDTVPASVDVSSDAEEMVLIQEALSLLTQQQQKVIRATILDGLTEREAADKLSLSPSVVNRLKKRALNRLKKYFILDEPTAK